MSAERKKTWQLTGPWAGAWRVFAGMGALGIVASGAGYATDPKRFAFSWLFAFETVLAVALGCLFFVLVQRLTSAGWSVTVRRTAEFFSYGIIALPALFIPVLLCMGTLFPWLHADEAAPEEHASITLVREAHAQTQSDPERTPGADGHGRMRKEGGGVAPPGERAHGPRGAGDRGNDHPNAHANALPPGVEPAHEVAEKDTLERKSGYLNKNFFLARAVAYFAIWIFIAMRLFGYSTAQDTSKDPKLTLAAQRSSFPWLILYVLTLTFAAFDWVMSLEPSWFSTIFGVVIFACGVVSSYATLILVTLALRRAGPLDGAVTVEHYHDMGKLMFGFLVFWGYVSFSQLMLIWYAALPEETTFYHNRWDHAPWHTVSIVLIFGHFVIPFFLTISRNWKRNTDRLRVGAAVILVMHVVDMYWFVMPNLALGKDGFTFHWLDVTCLLACAGVYGAVVFYRMTKNPMIPVGDPRLERCLHFQNA